MKNSKGITLITLTITIFILLLLSSTLILSSRGTYSVIKTQNFISKMKIIQSKVDNISEEEINLPDNLKLTQVNAHYSEFQQIINDLKNDNQIENWNPEDEDLSNYYYFTQSDLTNTLGIKDVNLTVIINFETRNVIELNGVNIDGKKYYRQYDIDSGEKVFTNNNS